MGSKPKKESNCPVEGVYLHDGICTREANLLQYKQTGFVINILLMRALNNMGRDEEKMDIALNYENGELTIVDSVNPNKKYNKTFFDRVGRGVKIGSYNAR
jgi:hypothetical protein